ncbi:hypothetical protein DAI22_07g032200 [Oryza sativa Japonica Group]|nr:hypothetical protein DAI22_07g032200 [Oryza sativa Japonica Group]
MRPIMGKRLRHCRGLLYKLKAAIQGRCTGASTSAPSRRRGRSSSRISLQPSKNALHNFMTTSTGKMLVNARTGSRGRFCFIKSFSISSHSTHHLIFSALPASRTKRSSVN